jgi:DNA-binding transcriptional LysR family regulator
VVSQPLFDEPFELLLPADHPLASESVGKRPGFLNEDWVVRCEGIQPLP